MLAFKYILIILSIGIFTIAGGIVGYDVYSAMQLNWLLARKRKELQPGTEALSRLGELLPFGPVRWKQSLPLALAGLAPLLSALNIIVVPGGLAGIRVSQFSGVRPGTLNPGVQLITPLVDKVVLYDTREPVFTTAANDASKTKSELLIVQAREGLSLVLAVTARYRIDHTKLSSIHQNLLQPIDEKEVRIAELEGDAQKLVM